VHTDLTLEILAQPTDETCGPACLHAVYRFLEDPLPLDQVVAEVTPLRTGGTLAAYLGLHALERGYRTTLYTYNLELFDPTWFTEPEGHIAGVPVLGSVSMLLTPAATRRRRLAAAAWVASYLVLLVSTAIVIGFSSQGAEMLRILRGGITT
jgi:hypothetical protein